MKYGIELNGIANLLILIDLANGGFGCEAPFEEEIKAFDNLKPQVELLERYMLAFNNAINNGERPPFWHEVRECPEKYPRNKDRP